MRRAKIPKEYEYLFNGSKWYCNFTEEEKNIYKHHTSLEELRRVKTRNVVVAMVVFAGMVIMISVLICLLMTK